MYDFYDEQLEILTHSLHELYTPKENNTTNNEQEKPTPLVQPASSVFHAPVANSGEVCPDPERERRKGIPEIILAESKEVAQIIAMAQALLAGSGRAIVSRLRPESIEPLRAAFQGETICVHELARAIVIYRSDYVPVRTGGQIGVISAGTSDIPFAQEAALIAEEMGCQVTCVYDVGVAGLHRLLQPLRALLARGVDVIIVVAGMDGALPSVVTGLVPVPVIGLPTSIGYGLGGKGIGALLTMLQTCVPGLCVVNIDNGIGAGSTAALIANRVAHARKQQSCGDVI